MNVGRYEVAQRKFVEYLYLAFIQVSPLCHRVQCGPWARRPSTMATHRVKPSRPDDGT